MPLPRLALLVALAMLAFAGNSLLCRIALREAHIDAASFTVLRLTSGALALWLIVRLRRPAGGALGGSLPSALALFVYATGFSWAYLQLSAATGALLLFGAVQASMILWGLWRGERLGIGQWGGLLLAALGLAVLLLPGAGAPPAPAALVMLLAGVAWGVYSLRGRGAGDAGAETAGNFVRSLPLAGGLALLAWPSAQLSGTGVLLALLSGALTSGLGYALWYAALPALRATQAATVQLSVPLLTALLGALLLGEPVELRLLLAGVLVLGGIAWVLLGRAAAR
ncbi:EamA family transporter [Geopseudomonas guangdongensis]|uniref:EamA-like transporter family protein n=1 Tax=Geopseudomonas guangdongensis TaxID=1245526 RepID=A0A1H2HD95_9GAMM|nr:EamA family transporter [Pseudomonas guangdongensis]SDU29830.1 EamA-like transporter family protein [Pseudomonas guangdongensis]